MKRENIPLLILIASFVLIVANIITSDEYDFGFWARIIANVFIILGVFKGVKVKREPKL
jgi:uncharacterized membrane protein